MLIALVNIPMALSRSPASAAFTPSTSKLFAAAAFVILSSSSEKYITFDNIM
jgi:hypothetical protein